MLVLGKMGGYPVHDHADAGLVETIDQVAEFIRITKALGRRKHTNGLVTPGAIKGIFCDRQKLHVGKIHVADIGHQLICQFAVCQICTFIATTLP